MSATNVATVAILNLCTTEKYFSKFEVECWNAAETTLISSMLVEGKWDSANSKWVQTNPAYVYGLTMGTVYHFRARVLPQGNGLPSAWSAFTPETAGDNTAPSVTYSCVSRSNDASVGFVLTPTTSDTDIHHYEVICRLVTFGASSPSAPSATDLPTEPKVFLTTGTVRFEKSFGDSQSCYVWVRAVDTSGNAQAWTAIGSGFSTNGLGDAQGQNLIRNGSFEVAAEASSATDNVFQGWAIAGNNLCVVAPDNVLFTTGSSALYMSQIAGSSVPANSNLFCAIQNSYPINAKPGQWYVLRFKARYDASAAQPAGMLNQAYGQVNFIDNTGAGFLASGYTNELRVADNGTGWQTLTCTAQAPAGATTILVRLWVVANNQTGSPILTASPFPMDTRFDAVELIKAADTTTDEVTKRGSTPPTWAGTISYSSTTTSVAWSWALTVLRTDLSLTSQSISSGGSPFSTTGLSTGTSYYWYPYIDENTISLQMVTGGVGSTGWAQTAATRALTQAQSRSDRSPLSTGPLTAATTSSGTGGGSGGGDGSCVRKGTYVKEKVRGIVRAETLKKGEYLWSENDTWLMVLEDAECALTDAFIHNEWNCGQILDVTTGHPWTLRDRSCKKAPEVNMLDEFICSTGIAHVVLLQLLKEEDQKVMIKCEHPHVFWAATVLSAPWILTHNIIMPSFS